MVPIIVTGGAGFIGSHLVERLLLEGHRVLVIDDLSTGNLQNLGRAASDARFEFVQADVAHSDLPAARMIFHLACPASPIHSQQDMVRTLVTAALGTLRALEAAQRTGARVVIVNAQPTPFDDIADAVLRERIGSVLPAICAIC